MFAPRHRGKLVLRFLAQHHKLYPDAPPSLRRRLLQKRLQALKSGSQYQTFRRREMPTPLRLTMLANRRQRPNPP
jgi:hypothetical protein